MTTVADAFLQQHLSPQWRSFLQALAAEFESQLSHDELRQLMYLIGERFASDRALPTCESTAELERALNVQWAAIQWGCVELADEGDYLRIVHYGSPLVAFGGDALVWASAFLQGSYQAWLNAMGASQLTVMQANVPEGGFAVEFHLARAAS